MPAIQNEYDDYSYIAMRRGTAKAAPRVADSKKRVSTTNKTVKRSAAKTTARPKATNVSPSRMVAAKNANKESIRAVMRDNSKTVQQSVTKKKTSVTSKSTNTKKKTVAKPQELSLKKADMMKSPKQKANEKTLKKENVVKNTAMFLCMFSVLLLICYRSSLINESFQALSDLKGDLEDTYVLNAQIESDIQTQTDLSNIETYAKYQLGMQKPKESQIQRIYVEKEDRITTPIVIEEEKMSFLDKIINDVLNLID